MSGLPLEVKKMVTSKLPDYLIKERKGGGNVMLKYISGTSVIDILNNAFDYMWDWKIDNMFVQEGIPYVNKYKNGEVEEQGPVAHVIGTLTVHFQDAESGEWRSISKSGTGSKSIMGKQSDQESIFKAAGTDAIKKAASLLGIALELYRDEDEDSFFYSLNTPWTKEEIEKHADAIQYIQDTITHYEIGEEDLGPYVTEFSEGVYNAIDEIPPDLIDSFIDFLKEKEVEEQATKTA